MTSFKEYRSRSFEGIPTKLKASNREEALWRAPLAAGADLDHAACSVGAMHGDDDALTHGRRTRLDEFDLVVDLKIAVQVSHLAVLNLEQVDEVLVPGADSSDAAVDSDLPQPIKRHRPAQVNMQLGDVFGPCDGKTLLARVRIATSMCVTGIMRGIRASRHEGALLEKNRGDNELKRIAERVRNHLTIVPFAPKSAENRRKWLEGR